MYPPFLNYVVDLSVNTVQQEDMIFSVSITSYLPNFNVVFKTFPALVFLKNLFISYLNFVLFVYPIMYNFCQHDLA